MHVCKSFTFDAAHYLPAHTGKCRNLHGHTYRLEIEISGDDLPGGMVMDFGDLKQIVGPLVDTLDHRFLNEIIPVPTAENMVRWFWSKIEPDLPRTVALERIRVWETPTSYAEEVRPCPFA